MTLESSDRQTLLDIARTTVCAAARGSAFGSIETPSSSSSALKTKSAVFVTLTKSGQLRGCIGTLNPDKPLWLAVKDAAWSAAQEDHRFAPVTEEEAEGLKIEISVLSPLSEISAAEQFLPGEHGIVVEKDRRRGVFLPKVAEEMNWTREQMLSALCKKAGLPVNAWQLPGMKFWTFTVESFKDTVPPS